MSVAAPRARAGGPARVLPTERPNFPTEIGAEPSPVPASQPGAAPAGGQPCQPLQFLREESEMPARVFECHECGKKLHLMMPKRVNVNTEASEMAMNMKWRVSRGHWFCSMNHAHENYLKTKEDDDE